MATNNRKKINNQIKQVKNRVKGSRDPRVKKIRIADKSTKASIDEHKKRAN